MTDTIDSETFARVMDTVRVVELNSQLLLQELRAARRQTEQATSTLSLVVGLFAAVRDHDPAEALHRVTRDLITCAEQPHMASALLGCDPQSVEPAMLRAAAALLAGEDVATPSPAPAVTH